MAQAQKPPLRIDAPDAKTSNPATFIFLHGFGDDADGWTSEQLF
jgi:lysophospholipase-2